MPDILSEIVAAKRAHIKRRKAQMPENALLDDAKHASPLRGFLHGLDVAKPYGLIAEIKKASPSKGIIREDFDVAALAKAYAEGGASCLSVLTDEPYFKGHDDYLAIAREACALPALRKDFMLEPYQVIESRALGADCVLLIMAALSDAQAEELYAAAASLGLDALVEVHDVRELERALTRLNPRLIGINNRSLKSFETKLEVSEELIKIIPKGVHCVSESGIFTHDDLARLASSDIRSFLVGESLMREKDVAAATRRLLGQL